jgi:hypothetical protein
MNIGHIIIGNVKFPLIESHAEILEVLTRSVCVEDMVGLRC